MAETLLFGIAESLLVKLASSIYEEASLVLGVNEDLREIKQKLSFIKAVLLDAEQKQEHNHELHEWLRQIKHAFSEAEDVFHELECEAVRKQVVKANSGLKSKVGHFFSHSNPLVFHHSMASQIKQIRKRLDQIAADRHNFGLQIIDVDNHVMVKREMTYSHLIASDVIGREQDKENVIELLLQHHPDDDGDKSLQVIPVVGIGGLGKTTLAKFVFNDKRIDESFSLKMWVCVSDDFDIKQLMIKILNSAIDSSTTGSTFGPSRINLPGNLKNLDMEQLQSHLRNNLASKKFLLVLDDVWNEDRVKWLELRNLIQAGARGSKVLVTTRSHSIASMMGTIPFSYILQGLSEEDSLSLFVKWAFKEGEEKRYPDLLNIGKEILKKCRGVPLAVRTLGSSLFSKFEKHEWESMRDNEIWNLPQKKDDILPALKLSYDQLPSYLRQCFALFSLYPKDYDFNSFEVPLLWGALGLLPSSDKNKTWEDIANQYVYELMSRSFLENFINCGVSYYFKIHDLIHDLALYVAKDECQVVNSHCQKISEHAHHLSFVENDLLDGFSTPTSIGVRTILFPVEGVGDNSKAFLNTWVLKNKYLRVLNLAYSSYESLPRSMGKLRHLRYLSLKDNTKIKRLPKSVCQLQNLEALILTGCMELQTLPRGLTNLICLRHLEITTKQYVLPENEIANLRSLQFLRIYYCNNLVSLFNGVELPTLKLLWVCSCESLKYLPLDTKHFPALETLIVRECGQLELLLGIDNPTSNLKLKSTFLGKLPQLRKLPDWLRGSVDKLQSLFILGCGNLEKLPRWLSTLTCLKTFSIMDCPRLGYLPDMMHNSLFTVENLVIQGCPDLQRRCRPQDGLYWPIISHIQHIGIDEPEEFDEMAKEKGEQEENFNNA